MKLNRFRTLLIGISFLLLSFANSFEYSQTPNPQQQNFGIYYFPDVQGWNYIAAKSKGGSYVFENAQNNLQVSILKEPWLCETKQEFNKKILEIIQGLFKTQEFMEQRKQAVPYSCLGQTNFHMLKIKPRNGNLRKFVFNPLIGDKMYSIEIANCPTSEPPAEALNFMANISLEPGNEIIAQTNVQQLAQKQRSQVQSKTQSSQTEQDLSSFKKTKTPPPAPVQQTTKTAEKKTAQPAKKETSALVAAKQQTNTQTSLPLKDFKVPDVKIEKGNIPDVKFSESNPCEAAKTNPDGLPWENTSNQNKIELPKGVDAPLPPTIPDIRNLSDVSYNSAVSAAFEGMRLIYGPMPDDEAKKFEAAWSPLFDYQTQKIVNYLNKLNPLISQFLGCRESYIRSLSDIQMVLFDAGTAIEMDDQQVWEAAMAEAGMYASVLPPLEAAMKTIAKQIETLGNPPSPVDAKCEARSRYKKTFMGDYPFEGEWETDDGEKFLLKIAHVYDDGKLLVYNYPISWLEEKKAQGFKVNAVGEWQDVDGKIAVMPGVYDLLQVFEQLNPGVWVSLSWSILKSVFIYRTNEEDIEVNRYSPPTLYSKTSEEKNYTAYKTDESYKKPPVLNFDGGAKTWDDLMKVVPQDDWSGNKYRNYINWRKDSSGEIDIALNITSNQEEKEKEKPLANNTPRPSAAKPENNKAAIAQAEQDRKDAIEFHTEMVGVIQHNLEREIAERDEVIKSLSKSKDRKEADEHIRRIKDLNLRIIGFQSNIQAEQDLVASHKTGQLIHTRTVFDEYARNKFIEDTREHAAHVDATRRIAERIDRQIKLLPWEEQAKAREEARKIIDGKTIASGDIEKAKKLVNAFNKKIEGYAGYDYAAAKEEEAYAEIKEQAAQATIMATGVVFIGLGSAALTQAYGAEAAIAIYAPNILGSVWGGTTGLIAGGPKEGLTQAVSWASPKGFAAMQFLEGYENAGYQQDATTSSRIWEGTKQAGKAYFIGKVMELGARAVTKASLVAFGEENFIFKPMVKSSPKLNQSSKLNQEPNVMHNKQSKINAKDEASTFQNLEVELAVLKQNPSVNSQKITQLEAELQQLSAGINMSYEAKWFMKYKASPGLRRQYDLRIQKLYKEMTPGMIKRLEQKGYNMEGIEFGQYRNATSGGTSSMDLDYGPVLKGTMNEPGIKMFKSKMIIKKDGSITSMKQFMNDSQLAMNAEYKQMTGLSAPKSDMNLVTSVHPEAFSTPKLLDHKIDFSTFTPEEVASIGKVLEVKMQGIDKNKMLIGTAKLQAKCRESSKEIENMLLRKLRSDLQKAPANSSQQKQIQADINFWGDMLQRFKKIGTEETNPLKIIEMNREIMHDTGGRDVTGVINDLKSKFSN